MCALRGRQKEVALEEKLQKEKGKQRRQPLRNKIDIVRAQREKGVEALEAMRDEEDRQAHDVAQEF